MLVCLNKPCHDEERIHGASDSYWRWKYWWKSFPGIYKWDISSTTFTAAGIHRMISEAIVGWLGLPPGMELASYLQGLAGVFWRVCLSRRHCFLGELFRLRNMHLLWVQWWKTLRSLRGKEPEVGKNGFRSSGFSEGYRNGNRESAAGKISRNISNWPSIISMSSICVPLWSRLSKGIEVMNREICLRRSKSQPLSIF